MKAQLQISTMSHMHVNELCKFSKHGLRCGRSLSSLLQTINLLYMVKLLDSRDKAKLWGPRIEGKTLQY